MPYEFGSVLLYYTEVVGEWFPFETGNGFAKDAHQQVLVLMSDPKDNDAGALSRSVCPYVAEIQHKARQSSPFISAAQGGYLPIGSAHQALIQQCESVMTGSSKGTWRLLRNPRLRGTFRVPWHGLPILGGITVVRHLNP